MVILIAFVLAPLGAGFVLEYLVCRLSMGHGRLWKLLPPVLAAALTGAVALGRYRVWASAECPLPTLLSGSWIHRQALRRTQPAGLSRPAGRVAGMAAHVAAPGGPEQTIRVKER